MAVVALLLAGCASVATVPVNPIRDVEHQEISLLPGDRPLAGILRLHEDNQNGTNLDLGTAPREPPRDTAITFHGIQDVYDEFARPRPAYVFRDVEQFYQEADSLLEALRPQGGWIQVPYEYAFDAADGRFLGQVDLEQHARFFPQAGEASPVSSTMFLFMVLHAVGGPLGKIPSDTWGDGSTTGYSLSRFDGPAPLPGACTMWEFHFNAAADPLRSLTIRLATQRTLVCLEEGQSFPLWTWFGSVENGARYALRTSPSWVLPPLQGSPREPAPYAPVPWMETGGLAGLAPPLLVPPSSEAWDWSARLAHRVQAAYLDPQFLLYMRSAAPAYLNSAFLDGPVGFVEVLGVPLGPSGVFDRMSFLFVTDTATTRIQQIYTRLGTLEQPDTDVPGLGFDGTALNRYPARADLPALVPAGQVQVQLAPFNPTGVPTVWAIVWSASSVQWVVVPECKDPNLGWEIVDARAGALTAYKREETRDPNCAGPSATRAPSTAPSWRPSAPLAGPGASAWPAARLSAAVR